MFVASQASAPVLRCSDSNVSSSSISIFSVASCHGTTISSSHPVACIVDSVSECWCCASMLWAVASATVSTNTHTHALARSVQAPNRYNSVPSQQQSTQRTVPPVCAGFRSLNGLLHILSWRFMPWGRGALRVSAFLCPATVLRALCALTFRVCARLRMCPCCRTMYLPFRSVTLVRRWA